MESKSKYSNLEERSMTNWLLFNGRHFIRNVHAFFSTNYPTISSLFLLIYSECFDYTISTVSTVTVSNFITYLIGSINYIQLLMATTFYLFSHSLCKLAAF